MVQFMFFQRSKVYVISKKNLKILKKLPQLILLCIMLKQPKMAQIMLCQGFDPPKSGMLFQKCFQTFKTA